MSLTSCIMTYIARSADPQRPECTVLKQMKALEISNLLSKYQVQEIDGGLVSYNLTKFSLRGGRRRAASTGRGFGRRAIVRVGLVGCEVRLCDPVP